MPDALPAPPSPAQIDAVDLLSRAMLPDEWAEFDAGGGTCSNMAGWAILANIKHAQRLVRAYPALVAVVLSSDAKP